MATIVKYHTWQEFVLDGTSVVDWDTDTIKVALTTSAYTPDTATHSYFSSVTNEVSGDGYLAGGAVIGNISVSQTGGVTTVDGDDVSWLQEAAGFTNARYAVIYKDTGTPATSLLIGYIDLLSDRGNVNGTLSLQWHVNGIFTQE